ncbi:MAG: Ig-like domain-containing protein [Chloroflexales bacterium]|nr:Ig-like domain-containing protein [Chloroflexales bacterium]
MTLLVVIVSIPIILTVWYGVHTLLYITPLTITVNQPQDSTNLPIHQSISLVFNRKVDPKILSTLQLTPHHDYRVQWNEINTIATIKPNTPWQPDTHYTLSLSPDFQSDGGMHIAWQMQFTTAAGLRVQTLIPENKSHDVALSTFAVIRFSQPMVSQTQIGQRMANELFQITPPISGTVQWIDQSTVLFRPEHWRADSRYTITNTPRLVDIQGQHLATSLTWEFHTIPTCIEQVIPPDNSQNVALNTPIILNVIGVVDPFLLRASIALVPEIPIRIDIMTSANDTVQVIISPQSQWQMGTTYQIQIGGAATTLAYQHIRFTTTPALKLIARSPGEGQILAQNQDIRFVFNTEIDTQTITRAVSITPPPLHPAKITSNGHDIRVQALWSANTQPVITIDHDLRSSNGITLSTVISSQLQINPALSKINLPGTPGDIIPLLPKIGIAIESQNVPVLRLHLYALPPAMLIRVLGMDTVTLQQLDPERYDLPLLDTQTITNPKSIQRFTVPQRIWQTPTSRYLLAIGRGSNGSNDVRIMRILPRTLSIMSFGGKIIVGTLNNQVETPATLTVFQEGQLIEQSYTDPSGIWVSRTHPQGTKFVILTDSNPPDAAAVTISQPVVQLAPIHIINNKVTAVRGSQIEITAARIDDTMLVRDAQISLCDTNGKQITTVTIFFDKNQTNAHTVINIPANIAYGIYTICGDEISEAPPIIIHPSISPQLVFQQNHTETGAVYSSSITDNAMQPIPNATIYWVQNTLSGTTISNSHGEFQVNPAIDIPFTIVAHSQGMSVVANVIPSLQRSLRMDILRQWIQSGKLTTVDLQISDPNQQNLVQPILLTVKNIKGNIAIRRTLMSDQKGHITQELAIPQGKWIITAAEGLLISQKELSVGVAPNTPFLIPEFPLIQSNDVMRFFYEATASSTALIAQSDSSGIHAAWAPIQNGVISTTVPISTTMLTIAAQSTTGPLRQYMSPVSAPQCTSATFQQPEIKNGQISLTMTTAPLSTVAIRVQHPNDGSLWAWYPALQSDANGTVSINLGDDNQSANVIVDLLQSNPTCVRSDHFVVPVIRNQQLFMNAPATIRIGDEIVISVNLFDAVPKSRSTLTITSTGLIGSGMPLLNLISDAKGLSTLYWHVKITTLHPNLSITSSRGAHINWHPTVISPIAETTNDGFFLQGKTIINTDNSAPLFDVIQRQDELLRALMNEPFDEHNPSQLAYRVWLNDAPFERNRLLTRLFSMQLPTGGWGWGNTTNTDPIITSDVVSAFASAGIPTENYKSAITYLQTELDNPQLPPTVQALIVRALAQTGWSDASVYTRLCANPTALGNEGLAALLDSIPYDHAYAIPTLLSELLSRSHRLPRGLTWDSDPATAGLHSNDSINSLILQASLRTSVSTTITNQIRSMLLSTRGTDGWSDIMTNARMWSMRDPLFRALDGHQKTTILDQDGHFNQTDPVTPGSILNDDITITSDAPVLVGTNFAKTIQSKSDTVRIIRSYSINGKVLNATTPLNVGDIIDGELDIISFATIPYLVIQDPLPTIGQVIALTPPPNSQAKIDNALLTIYSATPSPTIIRCSYRIKITHAGTIIIPASAASDVTGTWHTYDQPQSMYVPTP